MNFLYVNVMFLLFILPFLIYIGLKGLKNQTDRKYNFINAESLIKLKISGDNKLKIISIYLWVLIIAFTIISLSRPLGKLVYSDSLETGRDIVIAVDISESMKADDINFYQNFKENENPGITRLEASKELINNLIKYLDGDKISLVPFSETSFPLIPLTNDYELFASFLDNLDFSYNQDGGTNLSDAIETSKKRFNQIEKDSVKIIIIISDGETHEFNAREKAIEAKKQGIIINTVGVGTFEGKKIYTGKDIYGSTTYKTYMGEDIVTKLDEKILKDLASITGGRYFHLKDNDISNDLYSGIVKFKPKTYKNSLNMQSKELFQLFLIITLIFMILELFLPYFKSIFYKKNIK